MAKYLWIVLVIFMLPVVYIAADNSPLIQNLIGEQR